MLLNARASSQAFLACCFRDLGFSVKFYSYSKPTCSFIACCGHLQSVLIIPPKMLSPYRLVFCANSLGLAQYPCLLLVLLLLPPSGVQIAHCPKLGSTNEQGHCTRNLELGISLEQTDLHCDVRPFS